MHELSTTIILFVVSVLSSAIAAMIGTAGGIILLSVMTLMMPAPIVVPIHGVVQLWSNWSRTFVFWKHVEWKIIARFSSTLVVGTVAAGFLFAQQKEQTSFQALVGVFILVFLAWKNLMPNVKNLPMWSFYPVGIVSGFLGIFVGATGPFLAPFFLRDDLTKEQIVATKGTCQGVMHLAKLPAFLLLGFPYLQYWSLLLVLTIATVTGTFLGEKLLDYIPQRIFMIVFQVVMAALAVQLILS